MWIWRVVLWNGFIPFMFEEDARAEAALLTEMGFVVSVESEFKPTRFGFIVWNSSRICFTCGSKGPRILAGSQSAMVGTPEDGVRSFHPFCADKFIEEYS